MTFRTPVCVLLASVMLAMTCAVFDSAWGAGAAAPAQPTGTSGAAATPANPPNHMTWPRTFAKNGNTIVMYAPQIDAWKDYTKIRFRAAVAVTPAGTSQPHYGVIAVQADTLVDHDARMVLLMNEDLAARFPGLSDEKAAPLKALVNDCLPNLDYLDVSLDMVLACIHEPPKVKKVDVNLAPPPIYYSDSPALLVIYMGQPQFKPIKDTELMFAVNTNWLVILDVKSTQYYLNLGGSWMTAPDPLKGPWTAAKALPASFSKIPNEGEWAEVKKQIPGTPLQVVPKVITSTEAAELIVTQGTPDYTSIEGTSLMYVSNPEMPLFLDLDNMNYYYLASGRWFRATEITGPWTAASADLPAEFAKIPPDSPMGSVLASIPNTQQARDAVLLASIPHQATIKIADAKLTVAYDGAPKFIPIQGTSMTYAVNTAYQVVFAEGKYYCCSQAVWFTSGAASGPWVVCTSVPAVIYTIPSSSPIYNCTYVQVYSSTPNTVVVGYTAGYSGEYVAATGALMFGAGMLVGAAIADNNCWYGCPPCYYSYGCGVNYSYAYGGYYRTGAAHYGPYGGAGWAAGYNPATGNYYRGGAAYGPHGAAYGAQAYNPWTNTYSAHAGGTNGYKSWGSSYVQQGSNWAASGHQSGPRGSTGWAENSSGQWAEGAHSNVTNSSVARTNNGVYAGHDGNVYKNTGDGWQKYSGNGNWEDTSWNKPTSSSTSSMQSRAQSSSSVNSWKSDWSGNNSQWKSNWSSGSGTGGGYGNDSWSQHDTQQSLNRDSWSRSSGFNNAASSWGSRSSGSWGGGGGGWGGGGGRSWGGGGGGWGGGRGRR